MLFRSLAEALTALAIKGTLEVNEEGRPILDPIKIKEVMGSAVDKTLPLFGRQALLIA